MGKALVIKGADFSVNALDKYAPSVKELFMQLLNSSMENKWSMANSGINEGGYLRIFKGETSASRVRVWAVGLDMLIGDGYSEISFTPKSGWEFILMTGYLESETAALVNVYIDNKTTSRWNWYGRNCIAPFDTTQNKLFLHIRKADNGNMPDTLTLAEIFDSIEIR